MQATQSLTCDPCRVEVLGLGPLLVRKDLDLFLLLTDQGVRLTRMDGDC